MEVSKITIKIDGNILGFEFNTDDGHLVEWNDLSREEQINILDALASSYHLFKNFVKKE